MVGFLSSFLEMGDRGMILEILERFMDWAVMFLGTLIYRHSFLVFESA
jgi:hypothetical protein